MATRTLKFVPALILLCFYSTASQQTFPQIKDFNFEFYTTEVQITDVNLGASAYATEYYESTPSGGRGALKTRFQGDQRSVYYDNSTYQISDVNATSCKVWDVDISEYDYNPIYHGWLNKDPLVIGPSASLWFAQTKINDIKYVGTAEARSIMCDRFQLKVNDKIDDLTYDYFFALSDWTTPYQFMKLRVPIRVSIYGKSSRFSGDPNVQVEVNQVNDFAYFKPNINDFNNLLPPIGIGCPLRKETESMPDVPRAFQYEAEVIDLLAAEKSADVEIQFQMTWFDGGLNRLARRDIYSKKVFSSALYDFNTGIKYNDLMNGSCQMSPLRETDFQTYDYGITSRMKTAAEVLNLDGKFYDMGKREIRGIKCDAYESVTIDGTFKGKKYDRLVVTAYFTEGSTKVGVKGEEESRIPVYYLITGWSGPTNKTLQLQYNIFEFDDVIWPDMYSNFGLERCFTKPESKAYFVLVLEAKPEDIAKMQDQDEAIKYYLKSNTAKFAKVPEMRILYLKTDYKPSSVIVTALMLDRSPASVQFYQMDSGPTVTHDPDLKVISDAADLEKCSYACVDEGDFPCKGFYFCNNACFLKSTDPFEQEDPTVSNDLGNCTEYMRSVIGSTNYGQVYLRDALENLKKAVAAKALSVPFQIPDGGEEIVYVKDIIVGQLH